MRILLIYLLLTFPFQALTKDFFLDITNQIQDNEFAVVGLPNGPPSAERIFKSQFKWLSSWEEIIIMFDEDEDGYKAVKSATNILPKNKYKVAHLPMKDPNQMLLSGKSHEIIEILNNVN